MKDPRPLQRRLHAWFGAHQRDLPWRKTRDPYAVFVSEMMLQQTQVETVLPYFRRFLKTFPTWQALARAHEDRVLKAWEGLGYYRRARSLQAAARRVVKAFGGLLPDTMGTLLLLPGVGEYSAGAVLSIAYGKPYPVVDGNVIRVYSRLFRLGGDLRSGVGNRKVWRTARWMLDAKHPGDWNQAVMELGALLCTPDAPDCRHCPLRTFCKALKTGHPERYPQGPRSPRPVEVRMAAALAIRAGKVLIRKRPEHSRWLKGLWEFPSAEGRTFAEARLRLEKETGLRTPKDALKVVRHQITHHRIRLALYDARPTGKSRSLGLWAHPRALRKYPFSSAQDELRRYVLESL